MYKSKIGLAITSNPISIASNRCMGCTDGCTLVCGGGCGNKCSYSCGTKCAEGCTNSCAYECHDGVGMSALPEQYI